jgi:glycosyltransferase involved in cell wall biosynthesis
MEERKLKILWQSNAPWAPSGYGNQTDIFTKKMIADGHGVIIAAHYGLHGAMLRPQADLTILPSGFHAYGDDLMAAHAQMHRPDIYICLQDIWVLSANSIKAADATFWVPIDHSPITPSVKARLHFCKSIWAMSKFGLKEMHNAGIFADYVPHGVDTGIFKPIDREEARRKLSIDKDTFAVAMVAANKGFPNRKSIPEVIKAWAAFVKKYPKSILHLHTQPFDTPGNHGLDIPQLMAFHGVSSEHVRLPDDYRYMMNQYSPDTMNTLYNAADVLLAPSRGEGFGIPVIEAQAAGCPVIVSDFSAQRELCGSGWRLEVDPFDDMEFTLQGSEQARIRPSLIFKGLEAALETKNNQAMRDTAREFAMQYDAQLVWEKYMRPAIFKAARNRDEEKRRKEARLALHVLPPSPTLPHSDEEGSKKREWTCSHCGKISTEPSAAVSRIIGGIYCSTKCVQDAELLVDNKWLDELRSGWDKNLETAEDVGK